MAMLTSSEVFQLSAQEQELVMSALGAYAEGLTAVNKKRGANIYGSLIARAESLRKTLFKFHYGVEFDAGAKAN